MTESWVPTAGQSPEFKDQSMNVGKRAVGPTVWASHAYTESAKNTLNAGFAEVFPTQDGPTC